MFGVVMASNHQRASAAGGFNTITSPDTRSNAGEYTSLALDTAGNPVVSYARGGSLHILHCDDPGCDGFGDNISNLNRSAQFTSLVLDSAGHPVVSYYAGSDLEVLHCGNPDCTSGNSITAPDTAGDVGQYTSLALDTAGNPVVSYYDWTNRNLKILHCGNANCTSDNSITAPDTVGDVGALTSIALDASGDPVVGYYDRTNGALKILRSVGPAAQSHWCWTPLEIQWSVTAGSPG